MKRKISPTPSFEGYSLVPFIHMCSVQILILLCVYSYEFQSNYLLYKFDSTIDLCYFYYGCLSVCLSTSLTHKIETRRNTFYSPPPPPPPRRLKKFNVVLIDLTLHGPIRVPIVIREKDVQNESIYTLCQTLAYSFIRSNRLNKKSIDISTDLMIIYLYVSLLLFAYKLVFM
jgi:hypothetical protein